MLTLPQDEDRMRLSVADLTLVGHKNDAKFAVAISSAEPLVASGGEDAEVWLSVPDLVIKVLRVQLLAVGAAP